MTDNEIIQDLECYIKENEFEYFHSNTMNEYPLIRKALDLINRQKAEIERLQKENDQFADIGKMYSEIKTEAVKEFAERLCEDWLKDEDEMLCDVDIAKWILDTCKEWVGEGR